MKNIKRILCLISIFMISVNTVLADTLEGSDYKLDMSGFGPATTSCSQLAGPNVIKIIHGSVGALRIIAVIIAIANGMLLLIPAVVSKDADALKKSEKKLVVMAVVLAAIGIFPSFVGIIGNIFDFDLSCIF